jgi:HD-GYP domain-containing protein (c-di-GMP phosphodiesterase class II)
MEWLKGNELDEWNGACMLNSGQINEAGSDPASYCRHCGKVIVRQPYVSTGNTYCSEHCFLKTRDACGRQEDTYTLLAETLVSALDLREHETGLHSKRVACHTLVLARRFTADPNALQQIYWGALLHDIGKIGIPDAILLKPGSLTESEWGELRTHPEKGYHLISQIPGMVEAANIILCHEERYDGSGYPKGLSGNNIPLGARLFMVIDTLDAITSDRPYRKGNSFDAAKAEILRVAGSQFDPKAVEAFSAEEEVLREMVIAKCYRPFSLEPYK